MGWMKNCGCKTVRCIETGETWPTVKAACAALGITYTKFDYRVRFGEPIDGKHFSLTSSTTKVLVNKI